MTLKSGMCSPLPARFDTRIPRWLPSSDIHAVKDAVTDTQKMLDIAVKEFRSFANGQRRCANWNPQGLRGSETVRDYALHELEQNR